VRVKILSGDDREGVVEAAEQLGLIDPTRGELDVQDGPELDYLDRVQYAHKVQITKVFAQLTPEQKGDIVNQLRNLDERVAVVADGVGDVPAMEEATLNITLQSGSQAALSMADIVLLKDSLQLLPTALQQGQRIVNGLLDILKVNIAQISTILLLIVAMFIENRRIFYYHPTHGGIIAFFIVVAPSLGLTLWASAGSLPRRYMRSRMWHFVVPAAVTMAAATLIISKLTFRISSDVVQTELTVTYGLVLMGLILVIFVQPPIKLFVGGDLLSGDWRPTYMALGLFVFYNVLVYIPSAQNLLRLAPLAEAWQYMIIGLITLVWLFLLRTVWRSRWMNRYLGILTSRFEDV
jgi:cation-transporting ATPase E